MPAAPSGGEEGPLVLLQAEGVCQHAYGLYSGSGAGTPLEIIDARFEKLRSATSACVRCAAMR
jgi:hypothetical protein